jgi:hypothetical protein
MSAVPQRARTDELSVPTPVIPPGPIVTLSPEEIARFWEQEVQGRVPGPEGTARG